MDMATLSVGAYLCLLFISFPLLFPLLAALVLSLFPVWQTSLSLGFWYELEANQKEMNTAQNKPELTYLENTALEVVTKFSR
jgi:hypothetical protein